MVECSQEKQFIFKKKKLLNFMCGQKKNTQKFILI